MNTSPTYEDAMEAIHNLKTKLQIEMIYRNGRVNTEFSGLRWSYYDNYFMCAYEESENRSSSLVRLLPGGYVSRHYHEHLNEHIEVLDGSIHYEIYTDLQTNLPAKKGLMKKGDTLEIKKNDAHYVFTPVDRSALMKIEFYE